ncbi:hypothetical protein D3C75_568780 [compost metagenome]
MAAVAFADGAGVVVIHHKVLSQVGEHLLGAVGQLFGQREDGGLVRSQCRVQMQHGAAVFAFQSLLLEAVDEEGQGNPVCAQGGLDAVRDVALLVVLIDIVEVLAGMLHVLLQVIVGAVRNAPQLAPAEGEAVFDVGRRVGVVGKLVVGVVPQTDAVLLDAQGQQPVFAEAAPVGEPFHILAGFAEEFKLHLLELAGPEGEVARSDFVPEALADLADAEGQLLAHGALHILEVDEDALCGFRAQINFVSAGDGNTLMGFEHQVELADVRIVEGAAIRAHNVVLADQIHHLVEAQAVHNHLDALVIQGVLNNFVGAVAGLTLFAVHHRVVEVAYMAGGDPGLGIHQNGGVQTHIVRGLLDELFPPGLLHIVLQFYAQRAVVPGVGETAINFGAGKNKTPVLGNGDYLIH